MFSLVSCFGYSLDSILNIFYALLFSIPLSCFSHLRYYILVIFGSEDSYSGTAIKGDAFTGLAPDIQKESDNLQILIKSLKGWQNLLTDTLTKKICQWQRDT